MEPAIVNYWHGNRSVERAANSLCESQWRTLWISVI